MTLGFVVLVAAGLGSQQPAACTFDTLSHTANETVTLGLAGGWSFNAGRPSPVDYNNAAQIIKTHFRPPAAVRLPLWARTPRVIPGGSTVVGFGLDGHIRFRLDQTGRLADDRIEIESSSTDLIESVRAAIVRADSAGGFAPPSRDVRRDKGTIVLRFVETTRAGVVNVPLMRLHIPVIVIDRPPEVVNRPPLRYPMEALRAHVTDRVVVRAIILEDGSVDTSSLQVVQATYREFAQTVLHNIGKAKFTPALVAGCPVPALVHIPFDFKIR